MDTCKICEAPRSFDTEYCLKHEPDIDAWIVRAKSPMANELYKTAHFINGDQANAFSHFYHALERRSLPPGSHAQFSETVYFILAAAASGVIGNLSFDLLKQVIARVFDGETPPAIVRDMDRVVFEDDYESQRKIRNESAPVDLPNDAFDVEITIRIKKKNLLE